jgi:branched-chain amino acid transport system permease protein
MKLKIYALRLIVAAAAPFALALVPGFGFNNYTFSVLNLALIYCIVAVGLNLLTGYAGLISLGHSGLLAVGAYITAGLTSLAGVPYWLSVGAGAAVCGAVGCLLAIPALRLAGPYLALVTVGFTVAVPQIITFLDFRTDGLEGFKVDKPTLPGFAPDADLARYYLFLPLVLGLFWTAENLVRSRTGRAWLALRDSEKAATACGVSLTRYKVAAFTVSAVYAGIAGGLYAGQVGRITATDFNLLQSILFLVMLAVGGLSNLNGAIIGAVLMTILPELVNRLSAATQDIFASVGLNLQLKNPQYILYGLLILLFVLFFPKGLVALFNLRRKKTEAHVEI